MKYIILLAAIFFSCITYAQSPLVTNANLESVTVFSRGAEMEHHVKVNIPSGRSEIIINNVAATLDEKSVQVGGAADLTIMSVSFARNYLRGENKNAAYLKIEDSLKRINRELVRIQNARAAEEGTKELLTKSQAVGNDDKGISVAELIKLVEFYKSKQLELDNNITTLTEKEEEQTKKVTALQNQLNEIASSRNDNGTGGQLVLQVMAQAATSADLSITYITPNAAWAAFYDLRADKMSEPLKLVYKANVIQTTGIDWKKVKLTLSTGNPAQGGTAPQLSTWLLHYNTPGIVRRGNNLNYKMQAQDAALVNGNFSSKNMNVQPYEERKEISFTDSYTAQTENQLSTTFDISIPYDIATNGKEHSVTLKQYDIPVQYKYYAAPRVDNDAFLMAAISDYEKLNLLPGEANIIFEGMYVGKSTIDPNITSDTLALSMGRDKKITIKREKVPELSGTKYVGGARKQNFTYEIKVHNAKKEAVAMMLKDQYPVTTDKEMTIELTESDGANVNSENGILSWPLKLAAGETKVIRVSYSVKYPKDKTVANL